MTLEELQESNPDALLADGFEGAYVGSVRRFNVGPVALYDYDKCIQILMDRDGATYEQALEYMEFNVVGAWVGEHTPAFASLDTDTSA